MNHLNMICKFHKFADHQFLIMRKVLFYILFVFSPVIGWTQMNEKPTVYIDIDPENCVACVGSIRHLQQFEKEGIPYYFVLKEMFKPEKDYFIQKYRLEDYQAIYIWSDSLYDQLQTHPGSNITLMSSSDEKKIVLPLLELDAQKARNILRKCKMTDTLRYDSEVLSPLINELQIEGDHVYSLKKLRREAIDRFHLFSGESRQIRLEDSVSKNNFLQHFKGLNEYEQAKYLQLPNKNEFSTFKVVGDTVFALSSHYFIATVKGDDTGIAQFLSMNIYKNGQYVQSFSIDPYKMLPDYYWTPNFNYYQGVFYFSVLTSGSNHSDAPFFMAEYIRDGQKLLFQNYYPLSVPPGLHSISGLVASQFFEKQFYLFPFGSELLNLKNARVISLPMMENGVIPKNFAFEKLNRVAPPFRINEQFLWLSYYPKYKDQLVTVKFNLQSQSVVDQKIVPNSFLPPFLDDFDYHYVYIPIDSKTLVRTHLSTLTSFK